MGQKMSGVIGAVEAEPTSLCVLGMHRSGTSTVARTINLIGAYLGEEADLGNANEDNPEGFWERPDITRLHNRLLAQLGSRWDSTDPLPAEWDRSPAILTYKDEIRRLVQAKFGGRPLWGWKDPRTCLLLPLWRQVLDELGIRLLCVYAVRSPLDVAASLKRRDNMPLPKALGVWINYNLAALQSLAGVASAFLSYDALIETWEPELRRCARVLRLQWPSDEPKLRESMASFIRPGLRHSSMADKSLDILPGKVRELYRLLLHACQIQESPSPAFFEEIRGIAASLQANGGFVFDVDESLVEVKRPSYIQRTWWRWKRSVRKRIRARKADAQTAS